MKVIPPIEITPALLTTLTGNGVAIAEPSPGETAWSATEVNAIGERRIIGTLASTVTISNASPAVITWTGHNLSETTAVVFSTDGSLPTGLTAGPTYYVRDRLSANTFTVAETPFGPPISTSSAGSGAHTATAHVHRVFEALVGTKSIVTMTIATPAVVTWTAHGRAAGDAIVFNTTGALPTGVTAGTTYYVISTGMTPDTFQFSATSGGAAVNTSGTQSGTHTAGLITNYNKPPLLNTDVWADFGPTNKYAAFDLLRNTYTSGDSPLVFVITPGTRVDAVGLAGVEADSVRVQVHVSAVQKYDSGTITMWTRPVRNWYEYFFKKFQRRGARSFFALPPYSNGVITITFTRATGKPHVGAIVLGMQEDIGDAKLGATAEKVNFTKIERDQWGNATVTKALAKPAIKVPLWIDKANLDAFNETEEALDGEVAFWAGVEDSDDGYFQTLQVLGFYRRITKTLNLPMHVQATVELEEM